MTLNNWRGNTKVKCRSFRPHFVTAYGYLIPYVNRVHVQSFEHVRVFNYKLSDKGVLGTTSAFKETIV